MFICSKFLSFILFLGKTWSKNLKLSKLTETWYRDTLLYAYYDFNIYFYKIFVTCFFGPIIWISSNWLRGTLLYTYYSFNVYFFKIISIHIFWANLVTKSLVLQINWNLVQAYHVYYNFNIYFLKIFVSHIFCKFGLIIWSSTKWLKFHTGVHCCMLIMILKFIFSKFYHSYNFGQIWTQNLMFSKLIEVRYKLCYKLITILICNFSKYLPFIFFGGKFHHEICCFPYLLKFGIEIWHI